jgi:hypothetical protein
MYEPIICEFIEDGHRYIDNGITPPPVTSVIADAGLSPDYPPGEHAARGTKVHELTVVYDAGRLDVDRFREMDATKPEFWRIAGYLDSYIGAIRTHEVHWVYVEQPFVSRVYGYAGTVDRYGLIDGELAVLDFKTSTSLPPRTTGLQTAAYVMLIAGPNVRRDAVRRFALHLKQDGSPGRFVEYTNPADYDTFVGLAHLYHWKRNK